MIVVKRIANVRIFSSFRFFHQKDFAKSQLLNTNQGNLLHYFTIIQLNQHFKDPIASSFIKLILFQVGFSRVQYIWLVRKQYIRKLSLIYQVPRVKNMRMKERWLDVVSHRFPNKVMRRVDTGDQFFISFIIIRPFSYKHCLDFLI